MLTRKDKHQLKKPIANNKNIKSAKNRPTNEPSSNHLTTDNILHHTCSLKYPSIGGTPKNSDGGMQQPMGMTRKQSIGKKNY